MKKIEIITPEGYEVDKDKSTFECIVFKEVDKPPMTWEEILHNSVGLYYPQQIYNSKNLRVNTEQQAKKVIALAKLFIIMDEYNKRKVRGINLCIPINTEVGITYYYSNNYASPIYFHSKELFEEAYKYNTEIFNTFYLNT